MQVKNGRKLLNEPIPAEVPQNVFSALERRFGRKRSEIRRRDLLSLRNVDLATLAGITEEEAQRIRLAMLGVALNESAETSQQSEPRAGEPPTSASD